MSWTLCLMLTATTVHLLCAFVALRRAYRIDRSHKHLLRSAQLRVTATAALIDGDVPRADMLAAAGAEELDRAFHVVGKPALGGYPLLHCPCGAPAAVLLHLENASGELFDKSGWCADCATDPDKLEALRAVGIQDHNVVRGCRS